MEIKLKTLTPIWTGGVETGKMDRLHETGIIGSLRWWYEAIVRGLGGDVCDPTNSDCRYDPNQQDNGLCDVCQLFGATGWRRRFRLSVIANTQAAWQVRNDNLNIRPPDRQRGWFLPPGHLGRLTIKMRGQETALNQMASLFLFLEQWGNLSAKPQLGYGLFEILNRNEILEQAKRASWEFSKSQRVSKNLPQINRFGFFEFRFRPERNDWWKHVPGLERLLGQTDTGRALREVAKQGLVPVTPALKNFWRYQKWEGPYNVEKAVFGTSQGANLRLRSKLTISWAYQRQQFWHIKGWIWLPEQDNRGKSLSPMYIQKLWTMVQDKGAWQNVLNLRQGELTGWPKTTRFDTWEQDKLIQQLWEAK